MPQPNMKIEWPEEDLEAVARQIYRANRDLDKPIEDAVRWAGFFLAMSASAATKKAPNQRKAYKNPGKARRPEEEKEFISALFPYYRVVWGGDFPDKGPDNEANFNYYLKSKSQKTYKKISQSGLAKRSWKFMKYGLRRKGGGNFAQEVEYRSYGRNVEIEMSNLLPYIREALQVNDNGSLLLRQALGKAARRMEKNIDRKLEKAVK